MTSISTLLVHDSTHGNLHTVPPGYTAGYTTGSPDIIWTPEDWAEHPVAVRICQDAGATDETADILDFETGAAQVGNLARWAKNARANFERAVRKGQRSPAIYMSAVNVTSVVNALIAGGIKSGVGLFIADWNLSDAVAMSRVETASGPFPVIGIQYENNGTYDSSIVSQPWHDTVSDRPYYQTSDWLSLPGIPADASVFFNADLGTVGYHDANGIWQRIPLP